MVYLNRFDVLYHGLSPVLCYPLCRKFVSSSLDHLKSVAIMALGITGRLLQGLSNALSPPATQSILIVVYADDVPRAMSVIGMF